MNPRTRRGSLPTDDAVTPLTGTFLVVAIVVILATVVGTVVLAAGGDVQRNVRAGVDVQHHHADARQLAVTYVEARNADHLNVTFDNLDHSASVEGRLETVGDRLVLNGGADAWLNVTGQAAVHTSTVDPSGCHNDRPTPVADEDCDIENDWRAGDEVSITVTAVAGGESTVVLTTKGVV